MKDVIVLGNIAGVKVSGNLHKVEAVYSGDTLTSHGRFVMEYDNLEAEVLKGKSPIEFLNKNSKSVNGLIKVIVPHSNPLKPGAAPKVYKVKAKRDLNKPYFVYIMGGVFDGLKETMLAPFFLHKEIKEDRTAARERRMQNREERKAERERRKDAKAR